MNGEQRRRVEELFLALLDVPEGDRLARLAALCADDEAVRGEVASLLAHEVGDRKFLDGAELLVTSLGLGREGRRDGGREGEGQRGVGGEGRADDPPLAQGTKVGVYTIHGVLGAGGMGVVYVAEQERPRRTVALKVIRRGLATAALVKRFEYEAEVLGRLQHPGIAQIYEAGSAAVAHDGGPSLEQPYIAMELVRGRVLTDYARVRDLSTRERLGLMVRVCDAVQHAHQRGVIHRDLKPGNILVDETGQPKVLDFGVARAVDSDLRVTTMQTGVGQLIGTLPYMSPEQVLADPAEVDTRADVYAIGVILYQLLTGRLPHDLGSRSIPEAARVIRDEEPARLSSVSKMFRGDIDTIVFKALEKDKSRRYQSASELAEDLRRHLAGAPIAAKNDSAMYLLRRQLRRYRGLVAAVSVFVIGLGAFAGYAGVQARRNIAMAENEREAKGLAEQARDTAQRQFAAAERERGRADAQAEAMRRNLYFSRIGFAQAAYLNNDADRVRRLLAQCPVDLRGWEWRYLARVSDTSERSWDLDPTGLNGAVVRSAGGPGSRARMMVVKYGDQTRVWEGTGPILSVPTTTVVTTGALSGGGDRLAVQDERGVAEVWDVALGSRVGGGRVCDGAGAVWAFLPGDQEVVSTSESGRAVVWEAASGRVRREFEVPAARLVGGAVSGDGMRLALGDVDGAVGVWDIETGARLFMLPPVGPPVRALGFSPDGARLLIGGYDTTVREVDSATGRTIQVLRHHANKVWAVAYSPDGRWIVSAGTEASIRVAEAATGRVVRTLYGHKSTVLWLGFSDDGGTLYSASRDGVMKSWIGIDRPDIPTLEGVGYCRSGAISPDGTLFAGGQDGNIVVVDLATGSVVRTLTGHTGGNMDVAFSPDGALLVSTAADATARMWDVATGRLLRVLESGGRDFAHLRWSPDGSVVGLTCRDGSVWVWNPRSGERVARFAAHEGEALGLAWAPDGKRLFTGGADGVIREWDAENWEQTRERRGHAREVLSLVVTPDGRHLVSAGEDATIRVWDLEGGGEARVIVGHTGPIYDVSLNRAGTRMATGSFDNTVRLWDVASGEEVLTLSGHVYSVYTVRFSPDGEFLMSAGDDGVVRLWGRGR